ncbi:Uncharacterised protein [Mycobacteroides abscessus subsp. abscessus]|uniref:3'-5' exonuclease n=1 Tax=Mycobacteroides abscessus TaxID=36809 RepID=UPI0009262F07|nr:3'-5' exoribonuclease [Mycobacteroides abscessus]SHY23638.1 Uncharacterised protein [Mycobacteroides abscessus subsp. abscessus]SIC83465.1 Uncharacterised protein [Mycobacteroides abscessus subsp. abscessus]SKP23413.1 Uncharacterised protein [Mycobacteroides abscessus subsp. abscessus]
MTGSIAFLDTETTGLHAQRRAWEIAIIRRDPGQLDRTIVIYVDVQDLDLDNADQGGLMYGRFWERHPQAAGIALPDEGHVLCRESEALEFVREWTAGAQIVGVNPWFDIQTLAEAFTRHGGEPSWHYLPECLISIAKGYVCALKTVPASTSEGLSAQCSVPVPRGAARHSALGDALWAKRWYDVLVCGGDVREASGPAA